MSASRHGLSICICTYQRPALLKLELLDLFAQTVHPERLIVVDGDAGSAEVPDMLAGLEFPAGCRVIYLPSNHGNLSYQRYLGWRAAAGDLLLYLDDDLRIPDREAIAKVIAPFDQPPYREVVGVTAVTHSRGWEHFQDPAIVRGERAPGWLRGFGEAARLSPGDLTSTGHRLFPQPNGRDYAEVRWLQGRVMAYRMSAITQDTFSADLFALDEIRCGLGEDTFLSRRVGRAGRLLINFSAHFDHPDADTPKSYPVKAYKLAYAQAYSRRFLNDHYRLTSPPTAADRFHLVKSYAGNAALHWFHAVRKRQRGYFAYAWGFTRGALRGLVQKPTAHTLTPQIDWWKDAEHALQGQRVIRDG